LLQQERDFIADLQGSLTKEEGIALLKESETLRKMQKEPETEENLATIPRLQLSDLPKKGHEFPIKVDKDVWDTGLTILEHELPDTNGMAYVDFAMDISKFDFDDLVLLPLFCGMLIRAGTTRVTPTQQEQLIDNETGGVKIWPVIEEIVSTDSDHGIVVPDGTHMVTKIVIRTSTIASTTSIGLFSVIRQIMRETNMQNKDVALQVLTQLIDNMEDDLQANGYKYTSLRIGSRYSLPGFVKEQWLGVTQLLNLRRAFGLAKQDWDSLATRLENMKQAMVTGHRNGMLMSVTGDKQALKGISGAVEMFAKDFLPDPTGLTPFPDFATTKHPWVTKGLRRMQEFNKANSMSEAIVTASLVNHVAKGGVLYDVGERIIGSDVVMTEFLEGYYLYDTMRFDLGAYDAWAELDVDTGVMLYQSMLDPNVVATLTVFEEGGNSLWLDLHDKESLPIEAEAAIIGVIGSIDGTAPQPRTTGYAAMLRYLKKETPETRQKWRDEVLATNKGHFMAMIERLGSWGKPSIAVAGGRAAINMAIAEGTNMTACTYKEYVC
jgi:presequence protease